MLSRTRLLQVYNEAVVQYNTQAERLEEERTKIESKLDKVVISDDALARAKRALESVDTVFQDGDVSKRLAFINMLDVKVSPQVRMFKLDELVPHCHGLADRMQWIHLRRLILEYHSQPPLCYLCPKPDGATEASRGRTAGRMLSHLDQTLALKPSIRNSGGGFSFRSDDPIAEARTSIIPQHGASRGSSIDPQRFAQGGHQ